MAVRRAGSVLILVVALAGCDTIDALLHPTPPTGVAGDGSGDGSGGGPSHQVSALPETEPNGTREQAMRLPTGRPVAGSLAGDDVDVFLVPAATATGTLGVSGPGIVGIDVFRPQDAAGYAVEAAGGSVRLPAFGRDASLLVTVRGQGAYTVSLDDASGPAPCGFAREPDDIASPGVVLTSVPATGVGCIATPDDLDVFVLPAGAWEDAPGFGIAVSAVAGLALEVRVKDHEGRIIARLTGEQGEELNFPNLAAPAVGDLFVEVRSNAGANESEPYRLTLRRLPPLNGRIELEPNDDDAHATLIDEIGLVNGYIHQSGDADHYRLATAEPRLVRLLAEAPEGVNLRVEVTGGLLGRLTVDEGGPGEQEQLCSVRVDPVTGFDFTVGADSFQRTSAEPYLLHFELLDGVNWEVEPNDDPAVALARPPDSVPTGGAVGIWLGSVTAPYANGYVFPPGDVDQYAVEVFADPRAAATYQSVTLRLEPNAPSDYGLELVDADGAAVAVSNTGTVGEAEVIALDLPAGVYLARVTLVEGDPCARPYRLTVQQTDFPVALPPVVAVPAVDEGSGQASEGSGDAVPEVPDTRVRPRLNIAPPPSAPVLENRLPRPADSPQHTWTAPSRPAGDQPPTFGGDSGR